ncbi:hypothetical protein [Amylibacter sp. IMCC11727]|uniref:hypothetical protein n=1 Tax=Amylibacter sp. IMCC11727 TaxID=3039851 RepID=UPI00244DB4CF|nr:hypothetical protein [Amylibacter sp. IMCC11727]WGI21314.1 hypothetical protein QBD29_14520 [Amylibacter sp. IMCC11727]
MTLRFSFGLSAPVFISLLVTACTETPSADKIALIPEQTQIQAHAACQAEQGLVHGAAVEVLEMSNGRVIASTLNGDDVTVAQARAVNQCARAKLLGGQTGAVSTPVAVVQKAPEKEGLYGCKKGHGVFQGGSTICPGY